MADSIEVALPAEKGPALFITTMAAFLAPFGMSSVNIALPSIGKAFQMDAILLTWVNTVYLLATAVFLIPFGRIADIYGRKRIFTYGILTFSIGSAGVAVSTSPVMLLGFRILQGMGASAIYPIGAAILGSTFPTSELGKVLGINVAAVYIGFSVGPFFGGVLTYQIGWRSIFLVNVLLGSIVIFSIVWKLKGEWRQAKEETFDVPGSILYTIALSFIMYGFSQLPAGMGAWLILSGFLIAFLFIKWEAKSKSPVLEIRLFRNNRVFAFSNLAAVIHMAATFSVSFLLSLYLQYVKGLTPEKAGVVLISQSVVQALFSPFCGRLADRMEPRIVASVGLALTAAGLFLFAFLDEKTTFGFIVMSLALVGIGSALFAIPNANAVMSSVENRFYGVASGTLSTMRITGMVFSMGMALLIFSIYIGKVEITPEYYPVFLKCTKLAFSFFFILCVGGMLASLARGNLRPYGVDPS